MTNCPFEVPENEVEWSFARSGGAGGQNVNKVSSKAILRWAILDSPSLPVGVKERFREQFASRLTQSGALMISSDRYRDQPRNMADCLEKVRTLVCEVWRAPRTRRQTKPTRSSVRKRLDAKKRRGEHKKARGKVEW